MKICIYYNTNNKIKPLYPGVFKHYKKNSHTHLDVMNVSMKNFCQFVIKIIYIYRRKYYFEIVCSLDVTL